MLLKPAATLSLSLALVLSAGAGCGESESEADPSRPSPTSSATSSPTSSPTGPELPFPDVEPAAGSVTLRERSVEVTVPEGWIATQEILPFGSASNGGPGELIVLSDQEKFGVGLDPLRLGQQAKIALQMAHRAGGTYERLPDLVLGGVPVVRIAGTTDTDRHFEQLTVQHDGRMITLTFELTPEMMRRHPDLVESVLNTWRWR